MISAMTASIEDSAGCESSSVTASVIGVAGNRALTEATVLFPTADVDKVISAYLLYSLNGKLVGNQYLISN